MTRIMIEERPAHCPRIFVREWIKKYENGEFKGTELKTIINAGWLSWGCTLDKLPKALQKMGNIVKGITNDYILDNYYVRFRHYKPDNGKSYVFFELLPLNYKDGQKSMITVRCDHPYNNPYMYDVETGYRKGIRKYNCSKKSDVIKLIDSAAKDFQLAKKHKSLLTQHVCHSFNTWEEMFTHTEYSTGMYNPKLNMYIFQYNDANALCMYKLTTDEVDTLERQCDDSNWSSLLSTGGVILDDPEYDTFKYSELYEEKEKYLKPSYEFCKVFYQSLWWIDVNDWKIARWTEDEKAEEE